MNTPYAYNSYAGLYAVAAGHSLPTAAAYYPTPTNPYDYTPYMSNTQQ